jgi:hypothetical protein
MKKKRILKVVLHYNDLYKKNIVYYTTRVFTYSKKYINFLELNHYSMIGIPTHCHTTFPFWKDEERKKRNKKRKKKERGRMEGCWNLNEASSLWKLRTHIHAWISEIQLLIFLSSKAITF